MGPVVRSFSHLKAAHAVGEIKDVMVDRESTVVEDVVGAGEELDGVDFLLKMLKSLNLGDVRVEVASLLVSTAPMDHWAGLF